MLTTLPSRAFRQPLKDRRPEETTILWLKKTYAEVAPEDAVLGPPNFDDHYTISRLRGMSLDELRNLHLNICRQEKFFSAMGGMSWHPDKGFRTSLVRDDPECFHGFKPPIPIHDEHEFYVWLIWEILSLLLNPLS